MRLWYGYILKSPCPVVSWVLQSNRKPEKGGELLNNFEIALQITLKAMEEGYIVRKGENFCTGPDPIETANQFAAKQICDFYVETIRRLSEI